MIIYPRLQGFGQRIFLRVSKKNTVKTPIHREAVGSGRVDRSTGEALPFSEFLATRELCRRPFWQSSVPEGDVFCWTIPVP